MHFHLISYKCKSLQYQYLLWHGQPAGCRKWPWCSFDQNQPELSHNHCCTGEYFSWLHFLASGCSSSCCFSLPFYFSWFSCFSCSFLCACSSSAFSSYSGSFLLFCFSYFLLSFLFVLPSSFHFCPFVQFSCFVWTSSLPFQLFWPGLCSSLETSLPAELHFQATGHHPWLCDKK